jgi:hypothetical protein
MIGIYSWIGESVKVYDKYLKWEDIGQIVGQADRHHK